MTWRDLVLIAGHCSGFYERGNTTKLPKAEHATAEWQAAMESLILWQSARIGVMRALNRHVERLFNPDRKDTHWGKRKLKRDQD